MGVKHSIEFINKRSEALNPMYYREKSPEFIAMQTRDKRGINNPRVKKTPIVKLSKFVYVYKALTKEYLGQFKTVECSKHFNMGKDTLQKYLKSGKPFKGLLFTRKKKGIKRKIMPIYSIQSFSGGGGVLLKLYRQIFYEHFE